MSKVCAFIPARSGSQRITNKNLVEVNGHPLISYTINCAVESGIFDEIIVSTDSAQIARVGRDYGAVTHKLRTESISGSNSPDIDWVKFEIESSPHESRDILVLLRPTNPLRRSDTVLNALGEFQSNSKIDSLRAMRPVREHPSKMWRILAQESLVEPFDNGINEISKTFNHSSPMQVLEKLLIQDASLEITSVESVLRNNSISGNKVLGFRMPGLEGFDLNYPEDLDFLNYLIEKKIVILPEIKKRFIN
jgi:CMP-N,N'-diacetyllegionaminic acid synthase